MCLQLSFNRCRFSVAHFILSLTEYRASFAVKTTDPKLETPFPAERIFKVSGFTELDVEKYYTFLYQKYGISLDFIGFNKVDAESGSQLVAYLGVKYIQCMSPFMKEINSLSSIKQVPEEAIKEAAPTAGESATPDAPKEEESLEEAQPEAQPEEANAESNGDALGEIKKEVKVAGPQISDPLVASLPTEAEVKEARFIFKFCLFRPSGFKYGHNPSHEHNNLQKALPEPFIKVPHKKRSKDGRRPNAPKRPKGFAKSHAVKIYKRN